MGDKININLQGGDLNFLKDYSIANGNEASTQESGLQTQKKTASPEKSWFAWRVTSLITVLATIVIPLLIYYFPRSPEEPKFIIVNSILRSDATLVIKANNKKAFQKKKLDIIFDGHPFPKAGIPNEANNNDRHHWDFSIKRYKHTDAMLKNGKHFIQVGFPGKKRSQKFVIYFINEKSLIAEVPKFIIMNSILRSDTKIVIKANNKKANQKKKLDIIFDGHSFPEAGIPYKKNDNGMYQWRFTLIKHTIVDSLIKDGEHKLKVSFPGEKFSDEFKILFVNDQPVVGAEIIKKDSSTNILRGKATTKTQIPENEVKVDIIYYHEDSSEELINVPVKKIEYQDTGLMYFEFETQLKNFPEISQEDSRYSEIFFAFKVSDKAGNEYYYEESYGQYVTGGTKRFGALKIDFRVDKKYNDVSQSISSAFYIKPRKPFKQSLNKITPIRLKVTSRIVNMKRVRRLDWDSNIPKPKLLAFVYRDGNKIGTSASNSYTDTEVLKNKPVKYYVEIQDELGLKYKSNTEVYAKNKIENLNISKKCYLRDTPSTLLEKNVKEIIKQNNFYAKKYNDNGSFENDFIDNKDMTITDQSTSLMWQKSGSARYMKYTNAIKYVKELNNSEFAGYNDWRIPTLDELLSLMEKQKKKLHISVLFSSKQRWCWTSDRLNYDMNRWIVGFNYGKVAYDSQEQGSFVRAVRCIQ
ncbi:protein containing DUF1566 [Candidatus Magnetomorum sp. HK-1]|nr:protein containing DUF1566 [Candidatus Magnetomorum sp. HK-1]